MRGRVRGRVRLLRAVTQGAQDRVGALVESAIACSHRYPVTTSLRDRLPFSAVQAIDGVFALLTPDFSQLWSAEIWLAAIGQLFFGVSAGLGTLTTYASFTPRETPVVRSAVLVCVGNSVFSLLAGVTGVHAPPKRAREIARDSSRGCPQSTVVADGCRAPFDTALPVFAFLGYLARERGVPVNEVVTGGTSLAFEVFPVAFGELPLPQLWSALFFLMLLNLGISSGISMTSPLSVALTEAWLEAPRRAIGDVNANASGSGANGGNANGGGAGNGDNDQRAVGSHSDADSGASHDRHSGGSGGGGGGGGSGDRGGGSGGGSGGGGAPDAKLLRHSAALTAGLHFFGFLSGLVYVTHAGVHWISLSDHFGPLFLTVIGGLGECCLVTLVYGARRLLATLSLTDQTSGWWWRLCWQYIIPPTLAVLLLVQCVNEVRSPFGSAAASDSDGSDGSLHNGTHGSNHTEAFNRSDLSHAAARETVAIYPPWALYLGWMLALGPSALAPACCIHAMWRRGRKPRAQIVEITSVQLQEVTQRRPPSA